MPAEIHVFRCLEDNIGALVHDPATRRLRRHRRAGGGRDPRAPSRARLDAHATSSSPTAIATTCRAIPGVKAAHRLPGRRARCKAGRQVPEVDALVREGDTVRVGELQAACLGDAGPLRRPRLLLVRRRPRAVLPATPCSRSAAAGCWRAATRDLWQSLQRLAALPDEAKVYSRARLCLAECPLRARRRSAERGPEGARRRGRGAPRRGPLPGADDDRRGEGDEPVPARRRAGPRPRRQQGGRPAVEVFTGLREWKNRF